ncbi:hypothetical protein VTH82DRAFT_2969 [Thermothelomyces myriococcoides]
MAPTFARLFRRVEYEDCRITEDGYIDEDSCDIPFWATRTGIIVKWSLFLGIMILIILYFLVAYIHLKQRIRKGLPPLSYHRFLASRVTLARLDPRYAPPPPLNPYTYDPAERYYYDMYAMPPPVYDPNAPRPPAYEPPANSTKVQPNQSQGAQQGPSQAGESTAAYGPPPGPPPASSQPRDDYAPPPGPPPSAVQSQSSTNPNASRD